MREYLQGVFQPSFPEKVINSNTYNRVLYYRSSWEKKFMTYCDLNVNILFWGVEIERIPYYDKSRNNILRTYVTDFKMAVKNKEGNIDKYIVEIKPADQCPKLDEQGNVILPPLPKRKGKKAIENWENACQTLICNHSKWEAARQWCINKGYKFLVITEVELGIPKGTSWKKT